MMANLMSRGKKFFNYLGNKCATGSWEVNKHELVSDYHELLSSARMLMINTSIQLICVRSGRGICFVSEVASTFIRARRNLIRGALETRPRPEITSGSSASFINE